MDTNNPESAQAKPVEGEDYYWDGPYMVFTAIYHRKRGYCCESGCRHCPYGFGPDGLRRRIAAEEKGPTES